MRCDSLPIVSTAIVSITINKNCFLLHTSFLLIIFPRYHPGSPFFCVMEDPPGGWPWRGRVHFFFADSVPIFCFFFTKKRQEKKWYFLKFPRAVTQFAACRP